MLPNVLDASTVVPKSDAYSKGMQCVKRVIGSIGIITSRQELIENHFELGNDDDAGLISN